MSLRARIGLGLVTVTSALALSAWLAAQGPQPRVDPPTVLAGSDIGFRIESRRGGTPVGKLVVRIDGQWVDAQFAAGVMKLGAR